MPHVISVPDASSSHIRDVWELLTERFSINIERGEELHAIDGIIKPYQPSSKQEIKRLTKLKRRYSSRK